jgi:hypothetical protein
MKFTLKDYQADAVQDALTNLKKARKRWHEDADRHAFSLTAVTGAGKTVMAAAAFEALFHGDDEYDFDADPGAVVIWFSDDPSLNEQTRFRLMEASDRIRHTDMVVVEHPFSRSKFEAKKIYFLNTQKLGKKSLLVRGFEGVEDLVTGTRPDAQAFTIWDTIRNTIEDPDLTLYLVLDEAHRGMGDPSKAAESAKSTIVQRLINGAQGVPGIPVVWGISATVERFNRAMEGAQQRITLPHVVVDAARVQESGLIKDTIILDIPDEVGDFDTVLVRRATDKLKECTHAWAEYAKQQEEAHVVIPLMVLQVRNTPDPNDIGRALDTIYKQWPELPGGSVAHVFGEHTTQRFGNRDVPYISPERVQESTWVRVLIAKDAISTGWDCPRAEVMVSFRAAVDRTHITQLIGRMVRSPLARRIPGNDRLNSVDCLLPEFNKKATEAVVEALMKGDDMLPVTGRVLINPAEMKPNPAASQAVWDKFEALPSQTRPQRGAKPAKRLTALAHELASDGILKGAGKLAHAAMHKVLDTAQEEYKAQIDAKRNAVMTVDGKSVVADLLGKTKTFNQFVEDADMAVIDDAYRRAARIFSPDISRTYVETLADRTADPDNADEFEEALVDARVSIAALGLVTEVQPYFDAEADKLAKSWLDKYGAVIKRLSHDRQESYRQITEMSAEPQDVDLVKPEAKFEHTKERLKDEEKELPTYKNHLLCDEKGNYPVELKSSWEVEVVETEMKRKGFSFWYRNPQHPGQSSLGIAYLAGDQYSIVRPDFIFFTTQADGTVVADIVDPHSLHLADALSKLQGLALYAKTHAKAYRRIESVAEARGRLRMLDLTKEEVRKGIAAAKDPASLFAGSLARDY